MRRGVRSIVLAVPLLASCGARLDEPGDDGSGGACSGGVAAVTSAASCFIYYTGPLSRDDARAQCESVAAHLAFVRNADDNDAIASIIGAANAFLGASDEAMEGTFVWDDGTPLSYTSWKAGEPNNGGSNGYTENCMIIVGDKGGVWDDQPCAPDLPGVPAGVGAYDYVCER